jgi:hypothetical protein
VKTYREMLRRMAKESGIDTPTADDLVRIDRNRKGKKLSNDEWTSKTDPEAKIAKLKDGRTHLAYKPEHAVDLDTGIVVAAALHPAQIALRVSRIMAACDLQFSDQHELTRQLFLALTNLALCFCNAFRI